MPLCKHATVMLLKRRLRKTWLNKISLSSYAYLSPLHLPYLLLCNSYRLGTFTPGKISSDWMRQRNTEQRQLEQDPTWKGFPRLVNSNAVIKEIEATAPITHNTVIIVVFSAKTPLFPSLQQPLLTLITAASTAHVNKLKAWNTTKHFQKLIHISKRFYLIPVYSLYKTTKNCRYPSPDNNSVLTSRW